MPGFGQLGATLPTGSEMGKRAGERASRLHSLLWLVATLLLLGGSF